MPSRRAPEQPIAQDSRDVVRQQVQTAIRQATRDAVNAARDAAHASQGAQGIQGIPPIPPLPPIPAIAGTPASTEVIAALQAQISGEKTTMDALRTELTPGLSNAHEHAITRQLDASRERLRSLQSQLDRALGNDSPVIAQMDVPPWANEQIPAQVIPIVGIVFGCLAFMTVGWPLARAYARRMDRRNVAQAAGPDITPRLDRIEQAIEAIAIEVERVSEGQRFTTRLVSEMRALPAPNPLNEWQGVQQKSPEVVERKVGGAGGA